MTGLETPAPARLESATAEVVDLYRRRAARSQAAADAASKRLRRVGVGRVATFAIAGALSIGGARGGHAGELVAAAVLWATFAVFVVASRRFRAERDHHSGLAEVNVQSAARALRDWSALSAPSWEPLTVDAASADLDVFGPRSLSRLLPPLTPTPARREMERWLATPADAETIARRQRAAGELAERIDFRDELALAASRVRASERRVRRLIDWAGGVTDALPRWTLAAGVVIPAATIGCIALEYAHVTIFPIWVLTIGVGAALSRVINARVRASLDAVDELSPAASAYEDAFALVAHQEFDDAHLVPMRDLLRGDVARPVAAEALRRLSRIASAAEVRASPMLHVMLQALLLWDWHVALRLEAWRRTSGAHMEHWLTALGDIECCAAFGALAHANPGWSFPSVSLDHSRFEATALGHPLLPASTRVANDVLVGPAGSVEVISGSNMSGKSTLLRAVGLNALLARAGGPVCAARLACPPLRVLTSIGVQDSVHDGISYFMAELRRLRDVIAEAERDAGPSLYLIDEMLRGTNAEERAVATRIVIERLLNTGAIGLVTTHDAATFNDARVARGVRHAHFQECFAPSDTGERMYFDYLLRPGPATSRNALRLLALVGITKPT